MQKGLFEGPAGGELARFLGSLRLWQGDRAGQPFGLLPWQRRFLRGMLRSPGDCAASCARGNGKTAFAAALAAAAIAGPLAVPGGEVLIVASSFAQGLILFRHVARMARPVFDHEGTGAGGRWRIQESSVGASIEDRRTGSLLRVLGSDSRRLHGAAPSWLFLDEVAQWPAGNVDSMLAALLTSRGKLSGSRAVWIGTRPAAPDHPFERALHGHGTGYWQLHAASPDDPPFRARTWAKANPSVRAFPALAAQLRREAAEAKLDPSALARFRSLRLNLGTSDVEELGILDPGTWERIEADGEAPRGGGYILGVDLGTSAAMSAAAAYFPESGGLAAVAAFPELPSLADRGARDAVGSLYVRMAERGELVQCGRRAVQIDGLLAEVLRRWGPPECIVADSWRREELLDRCEATGFPVRDVVWRRNGKWDGADDLRAFRRAALEGQLTPERSLLLRSAMAEARAKRDDPGNEWLAKGSEGNRRRRGKDDAVAASILAVAEGYRRMQSPPDSGFAYHGPI